MRTRLVLASALILGVAAAPLMAQDPGDGIPPSSGQIELSEGTRSLLLEEMNAIQKGMMDLVPAVVSGDWDTIATIGQQIRDSFILKQQLTDEQVEELHTALPVGFRELDAAFHQSAGMLVHAAEAQKMELVNFYVYRLTEGCVQCHSKYATERFPAFAAKAKSEQHQH